MSRRTSRPILAALLAAGGTATVVGTTALAALVAAIVSPFGLTSLTTPVTGAPAIPATWSTRFHQAASACPGLPWEVLAAIGAVESDDGRSDLPGVRSGANAAGAEGPLQFEPATFVRYALPVPVGGADPPTPYDPTDATWAAARMLCADGARDGTDLPGAIYAYNHSRAYVAEVLADAAAYAGAAPTAPAPAPAAAAAVSYALAQIGTPYRWGGETPGVGFDCSGLVQAAERAAGITLPRVAQAQFDAGAVVPPGQPIVAGDLVFFGRGPRRVEHVGLVVGPGLMVDAPRAGAVVRLEGFPTRVGAWWGDEVLLGATRP